MASLGGRTFILSEGVREKEIGRKRKWSPNDFFLRTWFFHPSFPVSLSFSF
ncbi:hypothetical protein COLO4_18051 [Corchorus olitorius]|uniref:Uncharacterized protein n=1 Tax=Corchorus olitorius TaxID=93759 RepID=A0A1R3JAK7_9ROSI|nr:hypothetical protein COLO4_18051 [Corchorus olitorius]